MCLGERVAQQDSTQLLATLKMTQLSGVLTLVYDMLVQSFNSLAERHLSGAADLAPPSVGRPDRSAPAGQQQQPRAPTDAGQPEPLGQLDRQLNLALHSLRLINYVAYIDVKLLQDILAADEMLSLQLRHVCSYLISHLVRSARLHFAESAADQHAHCSAQLIGSELMNEIILLLGHFAYLNQDNQLILKSGRQPTIIEQLVALPFDYFSRAKLKLVLMPTLISCAHLNEQICALLCQELSLSMLTSFIDVSSALVRPSHLSVGAQ